MANNTSIKYDQIIGDINKRRFTPIYLLEGEETYYIDEITKELEEKVLKPEEKSFNQTIAATGRLSSTDPNLQNIPIKTDEGREIRRAFIPGGLDFRIMSADYSQIELRIMAHFADDATMIQSFRKGEDIHRRTAAEVYGVDIKDVDMNDTYGARG